MAHGVRHAHIDDALQAEHGAHGGGGHAVLPGAGFGNDAPLAHPLRQQTLSQSVVDFVRAGVRQILAFEVNLRPAAVPGEVGGVVQRRRPPGVMRQQVMQLRGKSGVVLGGAVGQFQLGQRRHHGFGNELAAEIAKAAPRVGQVGVGNGCGRHTGSLWHG